jgi:hypothetical protein
MGKLSLLALRSVPDGCGATRYWLPQIGVTVIVGSWMPIYGLGGHSGSRILQPVL